MSISIGSKPISKVLLSFAGAVLVAVVIAILAVGPGILDLGGREIAALIIAAAAPVAIAYAKKLVPADVLQIIRSIPPAQLEQLVLAAHGYRLIDPGEAPVQVLTSVPDPATAPPVKHDSPY